MHDGAVQLPDPLCDELLERVRAGAQRPGMTAGAWDGVEYLRADEPMRKTAASYEPSVCIVAQGKKIAWLDEGQAVPYEALHFLVVGVPMPIDAEILEASPERPFFAVRLKLDVPLLTDVLSTLGNTVSHAPELESPQVALAASPLEERLLEAVVRILRAERDPLERRVLLPSLQRELLFRLALGPQSALLRQIVRRDTQGNAVVRAIRHVETHYTETLSVGQLAEVAHMGESTFHRAFRDVTGTTPLRYLKRFRLHRARDFMLNEDLTAAQAADRVGYASPSQFSREFKALFGESPRRSIELLRSGVFSQPPDA